MKHNNFKFKKGIIFLLCTLILTGCATQPYSGSYHPPEFFLGMFHGFFILFSLIGSFFTDIRIYSFPNSGLWYDVGFFIGAFMFLGGSGASAGGKK